LTLEERVEALEKKMAALEQAGQPEIKSSEEIRMTFSQAEALGVLKP
jgi:predicted TIM-barrel fold metal-dependent hydrolase